MEQDAEINEEKSDDTVIDIDDAASSSEDEDMSFEDASSGWETYTLTAIYMSLIILGSKYAPKINPGKSVFMNPFDRDAPAQWDFFVISSITDS